MARKVSGKSCGSVGEGKRVQFDSNLSPEEIDGLKSLKQRIAKRELVVCDTDKSKRFAIMSMQQYLEAGLVHTKNDIEIEPHLIKKFQTCVNNHVWWAREVFNIGENWGHSDRMSANLMDKGDQTCQMTLLCKDHKNWSFESGKPPPTRPVIAGNAGLNCHLSEIVSSLIDPISYEESSNEIDSTDELLAKIESINNRIPSKDEVPEFELLVNNNVETNEQTNLVIEPSNETPLKYAKNDIRSFGVLGSKTDMSSPKTELFERLNCLKDSRCNMTNLPKVSDRMKAGTILDRVNDGQTIKLPGKMVESNVSRKQKPSGLAIIGADVTSLFPSLRNVETARLARLAVLNSSVEFENVDCRKALRYMHIIGGNELISSRGLGRLAPKWKGKREDLITIGGDKPREASNWSDSKREIFQSDRKKIVATMVEILTNVSMSTHVYSFCGHFYVQRNGGPIGLRSTESLASLVMKLWDQAWMNLLAREEITVFEYLRYVDDSRDFARPLEEGVRWDGQNFSFRECWRREDLDSCLSDEARTTREFIRAKSSILDFLQFEGENSSMFLDAKLPTLDSAIWVTDDGSIGYTF